MYIYRLVVWSFQGLWALLGWLPLCWRTHLGLWHGTAQQPLIDSSGATIQWRIWLETVVSASGLMKYRAASLWLGLHCNCFRLWWVCLTLSLQLKFIFQMLYTTANIEFIFGVYYRVHYSKYNILYLMCHIIPCGLIFYLLGYHCNDGCNTLSHK